MFCGVGFAVCGEEVQSFVSTAGWDSKGTGTQLGWLPSAGFAGYASGFP